MGVWIIAAAVAAVAVTASLVLLWRAYKEAFNDDGDHRY